MKSLTLFLVSFFCFASTVSAQETHFPLGIWYEGGVGALRQNVVPEDPVEAAKMYDRDFADIAKHGIDVIVVPNTTPAHHKPLLDAAQKHNLKLIIELAHEGGDIGNMIRGAAPIDLARVHQMFETHLKPIQSHPALWKVQLLDEPPIPALEHYFQTAEALRQYDPRHAPFCCLVGDGPVEPFVKSTRSDVAAFDCYPIGVNTPKGDGKTLRDFAQVASRAALAAERNSAHAWAVLQCHAITGQLRFPTPAELRCMTWLSLATGSKGVFWFLYQTESLDPARTSIMSGLVDEKSQSSDRWDEVAKLTKEIKPLIPTLMQLTPSTEAASTKKNVSAYMLKDKQGRRYIFAVNINTSERRSIPVGISSTKDITVTRLPDNQKVQPTREGENLSWSADLEPGAAALYRID